MTDPQIMLELFFMLNALLTFASNLHEVNCDYFLRLALKVKFNSGCTNLPSKSWTKESKKQFQSCISSD